MKILDHATAIKFVGRDGLEPRFQNMNYGRQLELVSEFPTSSQKTVGTTVGRRRRHQDPDPVIGWVVAVSKVTHQSEELLSGRTRQGPQLF